VDVVIRRTRTRRLTALRESEEEIGLTADGSRSLVTCRIHLVISRLSVTPSCWLVGPGFQPKPDPVESATSLRFAERSFSIAYTARGRRQIFQTARCDLRYELRLAKRLGSNGGYVMTLYRTVFGAQRA